MQDLEKDLEEKDLEEKDLEEKDFEEQDLEAQGLKGIMHNPVTRREFMRRLRVAGLGAVALPLLAGCGGNSVTSGKYSNAAFPGIVGRNAIEVVLNYALTLELAEAELYKQSLNRASGRAITEVLDPKLPLPGALGQYTLTIASGGLDSATAKAAFLYLLQFAYIEATHRDFLTATLTTLNAPIAQANVKGYQYLNNEPGADLKTILANLYPIEETGVRAYLGAVPALVNDTNNNIAQIAASLYSTEARHSATLAYFLGKDAGPSLGSAATTDLTVTGTTYPHPDTFEYFSQPADVLAKVTANYFVK